MKEHEVICTNCKGKGSIPTPYILNGKDVTLRCLTCQGEGKLDWVENVTGRKSDTPWCDKYDEDDKRKE